MIGLDHVLARKRFERGGSNVGAVPQQIGEIGFANPMSDEVAYTELVRKTGHDAIVMPVDGDHSTKKLFGKRARGSRIQPIAAGFKKFTSEASFLSCALQPGTAGNGWKGI